MKKLLFFLLITIGFSLQHSLMANEPDSAYVFAYATDKNAGRNGLHFAWSTDRNTWHSIGPERTFLRSEYASGRHGKRMLSPYLIKGNDGMWHCLWSVHEGYAVFAHCTSTDLISWGQQAFPTTGNTGNCMNPSVNSRPPAKTILSHGIAYRGKTRKPTVAARKISVLTVFHKRRMLPSPIDNRSQSTESQKAEPSTV